MVAALVLATLAGPEGPVHVAVSGRGVVALVLGGDRETFEAIVGRRLRGLDAPDAAARATWRRIEPAVTAIVDDGAHGVRTVPIDLRDRPPFDQRVLAAVREVPWGRTASYAEIARRVGAPRAARAVGGAVGRCPIDLLIPCHRIIAADGTLGGYGGDGAPDRGDALERKRWLLLREGVTVSPRAP